MNAHWWKEDYETFVRRHLEGDPEWCRHTCEKCGRATNYPHQDQPIPHECPICGHKCSCGFVTGAH